MAVVENPIELEGATKERLSSERIAEALRNAHRREARTPVAEVADELQKIFGREATAMMAGVQNTRSVSLWVRGESEPHTTNEIRLRLAYRIALFFRRAGENDQTIRTWFLGLNHDLNDRSPVAVIAKDYPGVLAAAEAFLQDY